MKHDWVPPLCAEREGAEILSEEEMVIELSARIRRRGDQLRLARQLGVDHSEISKALSGAMRVSTNLAAGLGYRRVVRYERVE
ncbi:MAG TPA: hypothetical protein VM265_07985 [Sphingomicrobium sp.]|nr:hypothetical protein [Sphingomicrobium sp.]